MCIKFIPIVKIFGYRSKNIVIELNKGEKLNKDNYEIRSMKIQYVLEDQEALEVLNMFMTEPKQGNTTQHGRDREAYETWKRRTQIALRC